MLTKEQFEQELVRRQTPKVREKLRKGAAAVAGLGGLGSNIALMLARTGIRKLLLADFDTVDPSNLNRQAYTISQIGMKKTEAMTELISQVNPWIELDVFDGRVTESNVEELFEPYPVICEAFDTPESKAVLVNGVLSRLPGSAVISGNGMAGTYSSNLIRTDKRMDRLYICGDGVHGISGTESLTAARVSICAGHEANMAIRLILGEKEV